MVTAMIELSRSLHFRVVAEQVEDQLSLDTVKRHGHRLRAGVHHRPPPTPVGDAGSRLIQGLITVRQALITNYSGVSPALRRKIRSMLEIPRCTHAHL